MLFRNVTTALMTAALAAYSIAVPTSTPDPAPDLRPRGQAKTSKRGLNKYFQEPGYGA